MGEIADMMLDGTMDCETGEWNFDGEDGPGFPMTGAEAAQFKRVTGWRGKGPSLYVEEPVFQVTKKLRKQIEEIGRLTNHNAYHWTVRSERAVLADWWPHKRKWRMGGVTAQGDEKAFVAALRRGTGWTE
jgi:hypothetical protein